MSACLQNINSRHKDKGSSKRRLAVQDARRLYAARVIANKGFTDAAAAASAASAASAVSAAATGVATGVATVAYH